MPGLPKLDQVIMNIIPERSVQVQGLLSGAIDAVEFVNTDDIQLLSSSPDVKIDKSLTADIMVMSMNCSNPILSDLRVRQAVNYAIDKQKVLDIAYGGGKVIGTFMDAANAYYKDFTSLYPFNPDKARSLLKEAGASGGRRLHHGAAVQLRPSRQGRPALPGDAEQRRPQGEHQDGRLAYLDLRRLHERQVRLHRHRAHGEAGPGRYPERVRQQDSVRAMGQPHGAGSHHPGRRSTMGFDARKKLYDQALEIMAREVPFVYLGSAYRYRAYRANVSEYRMTPKLDTYDFRWTDLK